MTNTDPTAGEGESISLCDMSASAATGALDYAQLSDLQNTQRIGDRVPSNSPVGDPDEDMHDVAGDGKGGVTSDIDSPVSINHSLPASLEDDGENCWRLMTRRHQPFKVYSYKSEYSTVLGTLEMGAVIQVLPPDSPSSHSERFFTFRYRDDQEGFVLREDGPNGFVPANQCQMVGTWEYMTCGTRSSFRITLTDPSPSASSSSTANAEAQAWYVERTGGPAYIVPLLPASHERYTAPPRADFEPEYGGRSSPDGPGIWFAMNDEGKLSSVFHDQRKEHATTSERIALGDAPAKVPTIQGERRDAPAGQCGLSNLGNTCFMNSALQCTSVCTDLVEYFTSEKYKADLNVDNPVGAKGELASAYSELMRAMWSGRYAYVTPSALKKVVDQYQPRFSGYAQHDSQEYLQYLLDGLHEDVNVVKKKPYFDDEEIEKLPDEQKADEAWRRHEARNESAVARMFQGQLRSSLQCNVCGHRATRFDPSALISVPVQLEHQIYNAVEVIFAPKDIRRPMRKLLMKHRTSKDQVCLRKEVAEAVGCATKNIVLVQDGTRYIAFESPVVSRVGPAGEGGVDMSDIIGADDEVIVVSDTPTPSPSNTATPVAAKKDEPEVITVKVVEATAGGWANGWHMVRLPIDTTVVELHGVLSKLFPAPPLRPLTESPEIVPIDPPAVSPVLGEEDAPAAEEPTAPAQVSRKFSVAGSRTQIDVCEEDTRLLTECISWYTQKVITLRENCTRGTEEDPRNEAVREWQEQASRKTSKTLEECLETYTEEEQLDDSDAWYCGKCKEMVNAFKAMSIWRPPRYVIIHLNRFSYQQSMSSYRSYYGSARRKVDVPIHYSEELDLRPSLHPDSPAVHAKDTTYRLLAVSCHSGSAEGGHYTAYACVNGQWCNFNDRWVSQSTLAEACNSSAYMLIYERKSSMSPGQSPTAQGVPRRVGKAGEFEEMGEGVLERDGAVYPVMHYEGIGHTSDAVHRTLQAAAAADAGCVGYFINTTAGNSYLEGGLQYDYTWAHKTWPPNADLGGARCVYHNVGEAFAASGTPTSARVQEGAQSWAGFQCFRK